MFWTKIKNKIEKYMLKRMFDKEFSKGGYLDLSGSKEEISEDGFNKELEKIFCPDSFHESPYILERSKWSRISYMLLKRLKRLKGRDHLNIK